MSGSQEPFNFEEAIKAAQEGKIAPPHGHDYKEHWAGMIRMLADFVRIYNSLKDEEFPAVVTILDMASEYTIRNRDELEAQIKLLITLTGLNVQLKFTSTEDDLEMTVSLDAYFKEGTTWQ